MRQAQRESRKRFLTQFRPHVYLSIELQIDPVLLQPDQTEDDGIVEPVNQTFKNATFGGKVAVKGDNIGEDRYYQVQDAAKIDIRNFNSQQFCKIRVFGMEHEPTPLSSGRICDDYFIALVIQEREAAKIGTPAAPMMSEEDFLTKCFLNPNSFFKRVGNLSRDPHSISRAFFQLQKGPIMFLGSGLKNLPVASQGLFGEQAGANIVNTGLQNSLRQFSARN